MDQDRRQGSERDAPGFDRRGGSPLGQKIGAELRRLRLERGWSQRELADTAGVVQQNLSLYERGEADPRLETLGRLLDALEAEAAILPRGTSAVAESRGPAKEDPAQAISLSELLEYVDRQVERALARERREPGARHGSGGLSV